MLLKHGLAGLTHKAAAGGTGLITSNLKVQFESDSGFSATSWTDQIGSLELTVQASMATPTTSTTPTGAASLVCATDQGLGTTALSGLDIPDGAEARTLYMLMKGNTANGSFQGIAYGTPVADQAFGIVITGTAQTAQVDFWGTAYAGTTDVISNSWHIFCATYDGANARMTLNDVEEVASTAATSNTVLSNLYIHEGLNDSGKDETNEYCALLIYSGVHDATQQTQMFDYLNDKYRTV